MCVEGSREAVIGQAMDGGEEMEEIHKIINFCKRVNLQHHSIYDMLLLSTVDALGLFLSFVESDHYLFV